MSRSQDVGVCYAVVLPLASPGLHTVFLQSHSSLDFALSVRLTNSKTTATMPKEVKQKSGIAVGLNAGHVRYYHNPLRALRCAVCPGQSRFLSARVDVLHPRAIKDEQTAMAMSLGRLLHRASLDRRT